MVNTKLNRSKLISFFLSLFILLNLTSCEGFFNDNDLENKIQAAIDYANAPSSSFWIAADATAGTITPIGKISYKPTDYQNIKFKLKPEYQFIRWNFRYEEVQSSEKYQKEISNQNWWKDYIEIVSEEISEPSSDGEITYTLQIQFKKPEENMLIEPICAKKPAIKNFVGEGLGLSGISREKELWFSFNSNIKNSIFYSQDEINSIAGITKILQSESGIYGYETVENGETKTHLKNINITLGSSKTNVNSFYKLIYNENDFTLYLSPLDILDFASATENLSVNFSSDIKNSDSASMNETTKVITLNKVTDKAGIISVKLSSNAQDNYQSYSLGERIEQTFAEDENTQFVKWQLTAENPSSLSKIGYETNENTIVFWVKDEIKQAERVVVSALSAPRPRITSFIPSSPNAAEPKDTDIEIKFDKPINLQSFNDGYKILFNGVEVQYDQSGEDLTRNFEEPYWDDEKSSIIIKADMTHRLDVDSVKKVTVQIPSTVYYESDYTDDAGNKIKIYLGKDEARTYSVDSSTRNKAYIKFNDKGGVELFNTNNSEFNNSSAKEYSIGEIQTIVCNEKQNYQLLGWINAAENAIEITQTNKNNNVYTYSFKILQACGSRESPVILNANVKERLRVNKIEPAFDDNGVEKDRSIKIYFNHKPDLDLCRQKIAINCSGLGNVKECFPVAGWTIEEQATTDGYLLTIKASTIDRINITSVSTVTVSFDANLYYLDGSSFIYYGGEGYSYDYKIKNETLNKAIIDFAVTEVNGAAQGTITNGTDGEYSIGTKIKTVFEASDDYEFLYWTVTPADALVFDDPENNKFEASTYLTVAQAGEVTVKPVCAPKIKILSFQPSDEANAENPCDSSIVLEVNVLPEAFKIQGSTEAGNEPGSFTVLYKGNNVRESNYANPTVSALNKKYYITLENTNKLNVSHDSTENVNVSIDKYLYYNYIDAVITQPKKIYIANSGYSNSFKVNEETTNKVYFKIATEHVTVDPTPFEPYKDEDFENNGLYVLNENSDFDLAFELEDNYELSSFQLNTGLPTTFASVTSQSSYGKLYYTLHVGKVFKSIGTSTNPFLLQSNVVLLPAVVSVTPEVTTIDYRNNIVFEFNQNLNTNIAGKVSVKTSTGLSLNNNYSISCTNNKITLEPYTQGGNSIQERFGISDSMDVTIELDKSISTSANASKTMAENYIKSYRLTKAQETDPPQFIDFRLAKTESAAENENGVHISHSYKITYARGETRYDVLENPLSIVNQMYVYFTASDNPELTYQSGVDKLIVREVQTYDESNNQLDNERIVEYEISPEYEDLSNGVKKACFPLKLKSSDGRVNVSFWIKDKNGNISSEYQYYELLNDQYDYSDAFIANKNGLKFFSPEDILFDGYVNSKPYDVVKSLIVYNPEDTVYKSYCTGNDKINNFFTCEFNHANSNGEATGVSTYKCYFLTDGFTYWTSDNIFIENCEEDTVIPVKMFNYAGEYIFNLVIPKSISSFKNGEPLQVSECNGTLYVNKPVCDNTYYDYFIDYKLAYKIEGNDAITIEDFPFSTTQTGNYSFYILPIYCTEVPYVSGKKMPGCAVDCITYNFTGSGGTASGVTVPDIFDVVIDSIDSKYAYGHIKFADGTAESLIEGCGVYADNKPISSNLNFIVAVDNTYDFYAYKKNSANQIVLSSNYKQKAVYNNSINAQSVLYDPDDPKHYLGYVFKIKELKINNDNICLNIPESEDVQEIVCYYLNRDTALSTLVNEKSIILNTGKRVSKNKNAVQILNNNAYIYLKLPNEGMKYTYYLFGFVDKDGKEWLSDSPGWMSSRERKSYELELGAWDLIVENGVMKYTSNLAAKYLNIQYFDSSINDWKIIVLANNQATNKTDYQYTFIRASIGSCIESLYKYDNYVINPQDCQYAIKDIVQGLYTTTVLIDKPALVQTFCNKNNYGKSIEDWDCYGMETEVYMKDSSFSIQPDLSLIPDDWYYVTVVRFIDDTSYITDVKQK